MNMEELYAVYLRYPSVQTDTRQLRPDDLFFALKGPAFNGNEFARAALDKGAAYAIIDEEAYSIPGKTILVKNVLETLQQLAGYHRCQLTIPVVAITGSNGKTTTKELVSAVLSTTYKTYTTEGNLNNHIGVPLTLLRIGKEAEMAVVEMGANHIGEIAGYCEYTRPTHGLITNCGKAHLEGFGSEEGVRKAKGELYDFLRLHQGCAFIMQDYDYLRDMSRGIPRIITYGTKDAETTGQILKTDPYLELVLETNPSISTVHSRLVGAYNLPNILAAAAIGNHFEVKPGKIKQAIESYTPSNSRSQLLSQGSNKIILDAYNANPSSLQLAIENIAHLPAPSKILMLGAMAELGAESEEEHRKIVQLISRYPWQAVVLVGGDFLKIDHPYLSFRDAEQAKEWYQRQHFHNATILVKGSRSIGMERIIDNGQLTIDN